MSYSTSQLVTNNDLFDAPEHAPQTQHIERIQHQFGCTWEVATMAYSGFSLYIPHCWVGTKTRPDGTLKGEGLVYGVMRNLGLGFLTKTTETSKAINITLRKGEDGKRDHQSCLIHFDRIFTRGDENAGNIAILEHLVGGKTNERTGRDVYNHLEIIYQEAGPNRYDSSKDDPARFWKVFLWRPAPERDAEPVTPTSPPKSKVKFTLVKAKDYSLPNSADPVTKTVHFPTLAEALLDGPIQRSNAESPPGSPSFEERQLAEDGFAKVGKGGKAK